MKIFKKTGIFLLSALLMTSLAACGSQAETKESASESSPAEISRADESQETTAETASEATAETAAETSGTAAETAGPGAGTDILVVYFSRTGEQYGVGEIEKGNTAIVADMISDKTGADSFEILPEEDYYPYTYDELTDVAKQEQNENARPAYAGDVPDLTQYSTVFIGAPVWWGDWPMIMYTFFENNADALAGKTLIPFSTHAGSGLSGFDKKLSSACPDSTVGEGLAVAGTDAQNNQDSVRDTVNDWLTGLGY